MVAEDIRKRWQEYTEELYKKDLHYPDNHDGDFTDIEPDILKCEVKWALESISTNKASGSDGIPVFTNKLFFKCFLVYSSLTWLNLFLSILFIFFLTIQDIECIK